MFQPKQRVEKASREGNRKQDLTRTCALEHCSRCPHDVTTLLEQVAATISGLDRVADGVGEGLLHHVVRVGSRLGGPPELLIGLQSATQAKCKRSKPSLHRA